MNYAVLFAMSEDLQAVLLLQKPRSHHNPLFRGRWTGPGGKIEADETALAGALREMREETGLILSTARHVLTFPCNCDKGEPEHSVFVFGATVPRVTLSLALGSDIEPVRVFQRLPGHLLWYVRPVLSLTRARLMQP